MSRTSRSQLWSAVGAITVSLFLFPLLARGVSMTWDVDPSTSYVRLTVPDQVVNVTNIGNITVRMRDANNDSQWTDAGGRRAFVDGSIVTDYADSTSIAFLSGAHNLYGLEQVNLRPNPAHWDVATLSYTNTGTAPAAFGARVRGTYLLTFDAAFMALRTTRFDLGSGVVPVVGGSFAGGQTRFGVSSAIGDVDGIELPLGLGQPVPDVLGGQLSPVIATNSLGGTIEDLGGRDRKLTYNISAPLAIELQGIILTGSAAGQIVAYGTIPEPPTLRISQGPNNTVIVAWPLSATGFILEQNPALATSNWTTVTNSPVVVGEEKQVTVSATATSTFYRLRSQ